MKNLMSVLPILSAVHHVVETPYDSVITAPENGGTDVSYVNTRLFEHTFLQ